MNKKVAFLVTGVAWKPLGGLKIIYSYAESLARDGHIVEIIYGCYSDVGKQSIFRKCKLILKYVYFLIFGGFKCTKWYSLDNHISEKLVFSLNYRYVGNADLYIATTLQSSYYLKDYKSNNKFYFIQGFENWDIFIDNSDVYNSYRFGLKKIVVSNWLAKIVKEIGEQCDVVYNGFDNRVFRITNPIEKRPIFTIGMMYNTAQNKGCDVCFNALNIVKQLYDNLKVIVFGIPDRPTFLPEWYEYHKMPSRDELVHIYNRVSIFIGASYNEGWGLTIGEAMLCGCAVACTNNNGYCEMAHNGDTALVSPIGRYDKLAENVIQLIETPVLKNQIAISGNRFIQRFNIEESEKAFKKSIGLYV